MDDAADDLNLSYIKQNSGDKYNSHFILLFENVPQNGTAWIQKIFRQFWHWNLMNVLILYPSANGSINIFTYNPFLKDSADDDDDDGCTQMSIISLSASDRNVENIFADKAINMYGSPLRVSLFPEQTRAIVDRVDGTYSGTDGYITNMVINRMNASLVLLPPTDGFDIGEFLPNGSLTGSLAQVVNHLVDVSFNTRFLRLAQFKGIVQITFSNGRDDICILVAKAGFASNIYNIFRAFSANVWAMTFLSLVAVSISFAIVYRSQQPDINDRHEIEHILFNFYSWNLAQPIMRLPQRWASKLLIAFWIVYSLLICSSYQGNLTSNLVLRPTLPQINTMRQLVQSDYEIMTFGRYVHLLQNLFNESEAFSSLRYRIKTVSTGHDMELFVNNHDLRYAYANKFHINQYLSSRKKNVVNGRPVFHNMIECPVPFLVAYAVQFGSPYLLRINTIIRRAQEAGFVSYWDKKTEETSKGGGSKHGGQAPIALTLDHMQSAFYIWSIGITLALVMLSVELLWTQKVRQIMGFFRTIESVIICRGHRL